MVYEPISGAPPQKLQWTVISVHECEEDDFDDISDDKVLVGILIALKHHSSSGNSSVRVRNPTSQQGGWTTAFQRLHYTAGNAFYDRIFCFADLSTPGKCFVIISNTVTQTDKLLYHGREISAVGDLFAIIEPQSPISTVALLCCCVLSLLWCCCTQRKNVWILIYIFYSTVYNYSVYLLFPVFSSPFCLLPTGYLPLLS